MRLLCVRLAVVLVLAVGSPCDSRSALAATGDALPTGARITPALPRGVVIQPLNPDLPTRPDATADHAVTTALSPDGRTLLILTSGYNLYNDSKGQAVPAESTEYVFVYDVSVTPPVKKQVLQVPNTFCGLAWNPNGAEFYVPALVSVTAGGTSFLADVLFIYGKPAGTWIPVAAPISLGHNPAPPFSLGGLGLANTPQPAGAALNADGTRLVVANYGNDSVTVIDVPGRKVIADVDLRPGRVNAAQKGVAGGAYPFWIAVKGAAKAYVSSVRDRELVLVDLGGKPVVTGRVKVTGQPNKMVLNAAQSRLYVAMDNSDSVAVVDTATDKVLEEIPVLAPEGLFENEGGYRGANPNSVALSPDEASLYVTNGGTNSVAVVSLASSAGSSTVKGLIPTGWYPSSVSVSRDGGTLWVVNAKGLPGPNRGNCIDCGAANQYVLQIEKAGFATLPVPTASELAELTKQVAENNNFNPTVGHERARTLMAMLRRRIKHVVFIVKENRTYDQVLGDLAGTNGDPSLAMFPEANTPNFHKIARQFVALDNFYDSGETSGYGWNWTTGGRTNDMTEKVQPVNYAGRGGTYDWEGTNRNINIGVPTMLQRLALDPATPQDPDLLPGTADVAEHDAPGGEAGAGYLWDAALRAGLKVRNYGFFLDLVRYSAPAQAAGFAIPLNRQPAQSGLVVAFPAKAALQGVTDPYFRGFDQAFPDYWLYKEWEREFDAYVSDGNLPNLSLVRFPHDHFGSFSTAIDGVNTPPRQIADNDYAVGLLLQKVAKSPYRNSTLVFVIEDDAQDGPDHVDAHRSIAFVAGPYVKQGAVVSTRYTTVNMLRTIEDVLGIGPIGLYDATQDPMLDVFDFPALYTPRPRAWAYTAVFPDLLRFTQIPAPEKTVMGPLDEGLRVSRGANWWAERTRGLDFGSEDRVESDRFNRILWEGIMGDLPYPTERSGRDMTVRTTPRSTAAALSRP